MPKPLPIFRHMPWHIKRRIIESADARTKSSLRKCSYELKHYVDKSTMHFQRVEMYWHSDRMYVQVKMVIDESDTEELEFRSKRMGVAVKNIKRETEKFLLHVHFIDEAVDHLVNLLRNPKVHISNLTVNFQSGIRCADRYLRNKDRLTGRLNESLSNLEHKISVEKLMMRTNCNGSDFLAVLPHLKPGTLKCIYSSPRTDVYISPSRQNIDLSDLTGLEQWKKAEDLTMIQYAFNLAPEDTAHFAKLTCFPATVTVQDAKDIVKNILRKDGWHQRVFNCGTFDYKALIGYLSQFEELDSSHDHRNFLIRHDQFECHVRISREKTLISFHNPKILPHAIYPFL